MSCSTLTTQSVQLNVTVGSLPEGFCPASMQELADAIGARLIVSPSTEFNTFAIGSTAPASNVGPWLKDCLEWFVFDDATATYVPITKGGFNTQEYHTTSGNFIVPDFIYKLEIEIWGGGGGGGTEAGGIPNGGGGGGGYVTAIVDVTPGQNIPYTVGAGGATGAPGVTGGTTSFLTLSAAGGTGGDGGADRDGGLGGAASGGDINIPGQSGGYGNEGGGSGGDSSNGGAGGNFHNTFSAGVFAGIVPGGGGCGGFSVGAGLGGAGAGGAVRIKY